MWYVLQTFFQSALNNYSYINPVCFIQVDSSTDKGNELAVDQVIKEEAVGGHQVIQVQANSDDDQSSAQLAPAIQHHIVELQGPDGMQQLQIANVPGQNLELQDIITALQQGQALTVQDGSVLPTGKQIKFMALVTDFQWCEVCSQ